MRAIFSGPRAEKNRPLRVSVWIFAASKNAVVLPTVLQFLHQLDELGGALIARMAFCPARSLSGSPTPPQCRL
jgi:hypothetical protein